MEVDRQIGLLLPCNVIVREHPTTEGTVLVEAMNPQLMVQVTGEPELEAVAADAGRRLQSAIDTLAARG